MKTYFSRITQDHWQSKNNLQKAAHKLAIEMDRILISENRVPGFKKEFQERIESLNKEFSRCKPLNFSISSSHERNGDITIWCDGVFSMSLFLTRLTI
jgi:hypothetical protein